MEEFRRGRDTRREVWYDENLVPGSTAARLALRATDADPDIVQAWVDFVEPEGEWLTYGQWIEGELNVSLEQSHGTLMPPSDWVQHYQWIERLWLELAKATEERYDRDGNSATDLDIRARRRAAEIDHARESAAGPRIGVLIPGQVTCLLAREGGGYRVAGWRFSPSASDARYTGRSAILEDAGRPGDDVSDAELEHFATLLGIAGRGDVDGPFWRAVQEHLRVINETSGEAAVVMEWVE